MDGLKMSLIAPFQAKPFKPEFTIVTCNNVIFIHYKPQIAVAILDL